MTRKSPVLPTQSLYLTRPAFDDHAFHMPFVSNIKLLCTTVFSIPGIVYAVFVCLTACATYSMRRPTAVILVCFAADTLGVFKALIVLEYVTDSV